MNAFKDMVGQEENRYHLQQGIATGKVSHAYLIEGEAGMGKRTLAFAFAKTLQCEVDTKDPCNQCPSCKQFDGGNHPDIHLVAPSNKTGYGVDDIREQVNHTIYIKPYQSDYKVYILEDAHKLTVQAQNALLKTIEEPPNYGIVVLLTENAQHMLPTILSRCVAIKMKPLSKKQICDYLMQHEGVSEHDANILASFARGNLGKALQLLNDSAFHALRQCVIDLFDQMIEGDLFGLMEKIKDLESYKDRQDMLLDMFLAWVRDLMVIKTSKAEKNLIHVDKYQVLLKQSTHLSYNRLSALVTGIEATKNNFRLYANFQLSFESLLLEV